MRGSPVLFSMLKDNPCMSYLTSELSAGSVGRGAGSRGTGDVASMRAGFRMIGNVMGGTPTCSGEARGWSIRGD